MHLRVPRWFCGGRHALFPSPHPDEIEPPPVFEKKPLVWEEDLELHSKFLHRKVGCGHRQPRVPAAPRERAHLLAGPAGNHASLGWPGDWGSWWFLPGRSGQVYLPQEELRTSHSSYLRQHPDVRALLSDFLLFLLLRQPRDVVTFAAEFFGPFDPSRPPPPSLRSSHRPSPFRSWGPGLDVDPEAD